MLKKTSHYSLLAFIITVMFTACNQPEKVATEEKFDKIDSLRSEFLGIEDSLLFTWNVMIKDDNEKLKSLKRLLAELNYTGQTDTLLTSELGQRLVKLKKSRYTCTSMINSSSIDEYDLASNTLVNEILTLVKSHPEFERNPLMQQLSEEVTDAESKILFFRMDYDDFVKIHNQFLEDHKTILSDIDQHQKFKKLPLFELGLSDQQ